MMIQMLDARMQFVCLLLRHKQQARKESEKAGSNGASDCDD